MNQPIEIPGKELGLPMLIHVSRIRSQVASRITWHSHPGYELLFLLEGATAYEFLKGETVELHGGHFLVVPPRVVHRGSHDVRSPSTICGIALNAEMPGEWHQTTFNREDVAQVRQALRNSSRKVHPFNPSLRWLVRRLMEETVRYAQAKQAIVRNALLRSLICAVLGEAMRPLLAPPAAPQEYVSAAIEYLRQHLGEPVRMPDLVRHLGYSRARMFQLFKSETGLTPNDYLQRLRVEHAQELLRRTEQSVTRIALETGFNSGQYFCTVFRRYTGKTPARFREESWIR